MQWIPLALVLSPTLAWMSVDAIHDRLPHRDGGTATTLFVVIVAVASGVLRR